MIKKYMLAVSVFLLTGTVAGQQEYGLPLDIPLELSANFGEFRSNHFHSGVDLKTGGVIGKNVFAIEDGYVSRIFVSPFGFGKALYVTHPSKGTVSVYAHLAHFSSAIEDYVRREQYSKQKFSVDLAPERDAFIVLKGEKIATSGNSGSSGGPHLHFEIREGGVPINIITKGHITVLDNVPPQIISVSLIEVDTIETVPVHTTAKRVAVRNSRGVLQLEQDTFKITKPSYFAIEVTERKTNSTNIFGVYALSITRDQEPYFGFSIDRFSFEDTRYINTLCKYPETKQNRNNLIRTYISPNNNLKIYKDVASRGIIAPESLNGTEQLSLTVSDDARNTSLLSFHIERGDTPSDPPTLQGVAVNWKTGGTVKDKGISVVIPEKALYESSLVLIKKRPGLTGILSDVYLVSNNREPIQKSVTISISADSIPTDLRAKALIVSLESGSIRAVGGSYANGVVTAKSSSLGTFGIAIDNTPPKIVLKYKTTESQAGKKHLAFKITDDLSGIQSYKAIINDKWALLEYDPKTATVSHPLGDGIAEKGATNTIKVIVSDAKGNTKTYNGTFNY